MTTEHPECYKETLNPLGVAVVIEASHLCMMMRVCRNRILLQLHPHSGVSLKEMKRAVNS
jgi:GTP cyclohydrolase I